MLADEIREIVADVLALSADEIDTEARLEDLGVDSLDAQDLAAAVEEQYSLEITQDVLSTFTTVNDILDFVEANLD